MKTLRIGIIGGGLMGLETASPLARWCNLDDVGVEVELTAVCDLNPAALQWFKRIPLARLLTADAAELLASPEVDAVYVAVPHQLHESMYLQVLRAGKDLLAEKPFGIDLGPDRRIHYEALKLGRFVRCSSEFPFFPAPSGLWPRSRPAAVDVSSRCAAGFCTRATWILRNRSIGSARRGPAARRAS